MNNLDLYFDLFKRLFAACDGKIFLKGNILLNKLLPNMARSTVDLDASIVDLDTYPKKIVPVLEQFGDELLHQGCAVRYMIKPEVEPHMSGGIDVYDATGAKIFAVDISLAETAPGQFTEYTFDGSWILGSSIDKIICDKCLSTLSRKRFRRIKDFYDLYIILKSGTEFDLENVLDLMESKVGRDSTTELFDHLPFSEEIITQLGHAWGKFNLSTYDKSKDLTRPEFADVIPSIYILYNNLNVCWRRRCVPR